MATSAATDSRGAFWAVTCTTGVRPRRPQVRPLGGLSPWPDSSSKISQAPRSAAVVLSAARSPPASLGYPLLVALGRAPGGHLHAPPQPVQQQIHSGQGVVHAEPL